MDISNAKQETLYGMRIYINDALDNQPRMQLSAKILEILMPYQAEFVQETNQWLADHFGKDHKIYVMSINPLDPRLKSIVVGSQGYAKIKESMRINNI